MAESRRRFAWLGIELVFAGLAVGGLALGICGIRVTRAEANAAPTEDLARQVTIFGVVATPGTKAVDSKLVTINDQLAELLPKHGFKLLDAQSAGIETGEALTCKLSNGYTAAVALVKPLDENGKVELRCELFQDGECEFSTLVKTPPNQLFFCRRPLPDGSHLLIGMGAR
jgi:hypothetical protein